MTSVTKFLIILRFIFRDRKFSQLHRFTHAQAADSTTQDGLSNFSTCEDALLFFICIRSVKQIGGAGSLQNEKVCRRTYLPVSILEHHFPTSGTYAYWKKLSRISGSERKNPKWQEFILRSRMASFTIFLLLLCLTPEIYCKKKSASSDVIEEVDRKKLEKLIRDEEYLAVFFCEYNT